MTLIKVTYARKEGVYTEMKSKFGPVLGYENGSVELRFHFYDSERVRLTTKTVSPFHSSKNVPDLTSNLNHRHYLLKVNQYHGFTISTDA